MFKKIILLYLFSLCASDLTKLVFSFLFVFIYFSILFFFPHRTAIAADPDRIVLKKIVLTGLPTKCKKRGAMIKYMFFNPEDVNWFKPVEMTTKCGLTGHIKQSVGLHGSMKCVFNQPTAQHDTVCMNLFKRVFPKHPKTGGTLGGGGGALTASLTPEQLEEDTDL